MENKKILITGGSSFIGINLINRLKKYHPKIINISRRKKVEGVDNINIDLANTDFSFLDEFEFDYVIHLAAVSSLARSNSEEETMDLNYGATKKLFTYLKSRKPEKIIYFSSIVVYEPTDSELREDSELKKNPEYYAKSKILAEQVCQDLIEEGLPIVVFRLGNSYGEYQQWEEQDKPTLTPQLIAQAIKEKRIDVFDENPVRDFIYIGDVCEAIIKSLSSDYVGVLNLGTGIGTSVGKLARMIGEKMNVPVSNLNKQANKSILVQDISKLKNVLNWEPQTSLDKGLNRTIEYYLGVIK